MTLAEWEAEGLGLFGEDRMGWRFKCPSCGHVACVRDWKSAGAPSGAVAFSCVGRWMGGDVQEAFVGNGKGPCNYAGGGLFCINPVLVEHGLQVHRLFKFVPTA